MTALLEAAFELLSHLVAALVQEYLVRRAVILVAAAAGVLLACALYVVAGD